MRSRWGIFTYVSAQEGETDIQLNLDGQKLVKQYTVEDKNIDIEVVTVSPPENSNVLFETFEGCSIRNCYFCHSD